MGILSNLIQSENVRRKFSKLTHSTYVLNRIIQFFYYQITGLYENYTERNFFTKIISRIYFFNLYGKYSIKVRTIDSYRLF